MDWTFKHYFCRSVVENESHALLGCMADHDLLLLRRDFLRTALVIDPGLLHPFARQNLDFLLLSILNQEALLPTVAAYICAVFRRFKQVPLYVPTIPL